MTNIFNNYKKLLAEFVSFKSVSTDPKYLDEIEKTVLWLKNLLSENKFEVKIIKGKNSNPLVFGSFNVSKKLKTVLIYGHYDVQPANKEDGWKSDPFTVYEKGRKLIARGIIDNKGQILAHIVTVVQLIKEGKLAYNVKFLIEGNEETGNDGMATLMLKNRNLLKCDVVLVSDGELTNNKPTIEVSLRGGFNCTLTYKTGKSNLHSGIWGGVVPNAATELSKFLSKLTNADNSIAFKEFYRGMDKVTKKQIENNVNLVKEGGDIKKLAGVNKLIFPKNVDFYSQTGLYPTLQVTGINAGYTEIGYANIVPFKAEAKINVRLVASQRPEVIAKALAKFIKANTPKHVDYSLSFNGMHRPVKVNSKNEFMETAIKTLNNVYKTKVNYKNVGGAIPFVGDVKKILGVDTLLIPLVNEDCNMHGTDENFDIDLAQKALEFSQAFLSKN
ncbi:MAG TPA: M20/M25/M40 family metallo-hydrolase [Patescibacteria group bacterium]|nr:M20/M25/M40 family metallo-hydrolase [Patescibacteria group bacterium]